MEAVYRAGVSSAERLQGRTEVQEEVWLLLSLLGDPKAAFLLLFPLTHFLSRRAGEAVLWTAAVTEWLNLVLKWMLFGERPFWWIGESGLFENKPPQVRQFPSTCETGPGSPSGHAMVTAAVWWVVMSSLASFLYSHSRSLVLSSAPFFFYLVLLIAVGLSRIFILAHFPHQVVAGSITGFILGVALKRHLPEGRPLLFFLSLSVALMLSALTLHAGLLLLGVDLSWSIPLAQRWCSRSEWVRLDSSPFSSLSRDCGVLLGLGLTRCWSRRGGGGVVLPAAAARALALAFSSLCLYLLNRLALPVAPPLLFYALFFLKYAAVPPVVMVMAPGLVHLFTGSKERTD